MPRRKDYIHKRADGRWEGRYNKGRNGNGRIVYGSVYGKTYQEVKEKRLNKLKEFGQRVNVYEPCLLDSVLDNWLKQMSICVKKSTLLKYKTLINKHIRPTLGKRYISEITSDELNQFILRKIETGKLDKSGGLSSSYVKTITIILNSVFKYAIKENLIEPRVISIPKPTVIKKELCILSDDEQTILKNYLFDNANEYNIAVLLSLYAGLRIGEVCALRWTDIDIYKQTIKVRHSIIRISASEGSYLIVDKPKTSSSIRDIPIIDSIYEILKAFQREDDIFVASGTIDFLKPRTLEYHFKQILKKCSINQVNYHALRHTFATSCIKSGVDVKSLSEILGHSNVSTTLNTYVHSSIEMKKEQLKKLILNENGQLNGQKP